MNSALQRLRNKLRNPQDRCYAALAAALGCAFLSKSLGDPQVDGVVVTTALTTFYAMGGEILGKLSELLGGIGGAAADDLIRRHPEEKKFENHHLTRLVGQAIGKIIESGSRSSVRTQEIAGILKDRVNAQWTEFKDGNSEPLTDEQLFEIFAVGAIERGDKRALTVDFWRDALASLMHADADRQLLIEDAHWANDCGKRPTIEVIATRIWEKLYATVITLLVNDAEEGGAAFADVAFRMLNELCRLQRLVANDVHKSHQLLKLISNAINSIQSQIQGLNQQQTAILQYARSTHQNVLTLALDAVNFDRFRTDFLKLECLLQQLFRAELPVDSVPDVHRWIELRHDSATLTQRVQLGDAARQVIDDYNNGVRHFLIVGRVASGKSTTAADVSRALMASPGAPTASAVLPLGSDFSSNVDGWTARDAVQDLATYLRALSPDRQIDHFLLVEDAHASPLLPEFTGEARLDLKNASVLVTCRLGAEGKVAERLQEYWGILPTYVYTDSEAVAVSMIEEAIPEVTQANPEKVRQQLLSVFRETGSNLFMLQMVIAEWRSNSNEAVSMSLAYEAVRRELWRIARHANKGRDNIEHRAFLALAWMIGGLDLRVSQKFLSSRFGLAYPYKQIRRLHQEREIDAPKDEFADDFAILRHPAWGLLVLKAIDECPDFAREREVIGEGFQKNTINRLSAKSKVLARKQKQEWKASESLMFALLEANSRPDWAEELAFTCSGKHISDEFVNAIRIHVECRRADGADERKLGWTTFLIAGNLRRVSAQTPNQQIRDWQDGHKLINDAIKLREASYGPGLREDKDAGRIYYQRGYYELLLGRFDEARATFAQSAARDRSLGGQRAPYAGMSKVAEAIAATAAGDVAAAESILQEAHALIGAHPDFGRFRGNAHAASFEIYIRSGRTAEAKTARTRHEQEFFDAGLRASTNVLDARMSLRAGEFSLASDLIDLTLEDPQRMSDAETHIQANRVKADSLLGQGKFDDAKKLYRSVLPSKRKGPLSFEHQLCAARLKEMGKLKPSESLGREIVMRGVV